MQSAGTEQPARQRVDRTSADQQYSFAARAWVPREVGMAVLSQGSHGYVSPMICDYSYSDMEQDAGDGRQPDEPLWMEACRCKAACTGDNSCQPASSHFLGNASLQWRWLSAHAWELSSNFQLQQAWMRRQTNCLVVMSQTCAHASNRCCAAGDSASCRATSGGSCVLGSGGPARRTLKSHACCPCALVHALGVIPRDSEKATAVRHRRPSAMSCLPPLWLCFGQMRALKCTCRSCLVMRYTCLLSRSRLSRGCVTWTTSKSECLRCRCKVRSRPTAVPHEKRQRIASSHFVEQARCLRRGWTAHSLNNSAPRLQGTFLNSLFVPIAQDGKSSNENEHVKPRVRLFVLFGRLPVLRAFFFFLFFSFRSCPLSASIYLCVYIYTNECVWSG